MGTLDSRSSVLMKFQKTLELQWIWALGAVRTGESHSRALSSSSFVNERAQVCDSLTVLALQGYLCLIIGQKCVLQNLKICESLLLLLRIIIVRKEEKIIEQHFSSVGSSLFLLNEHIYSLFSMLAQNKSPNSVVFLFFFYIYFQFGTLRNTLHKVIQVKEQCYFF